MILIKASKTEEDHFNNVLVSEESNIEKLMDIAENIFSSLCEKWNCNDITFQFVKRKKIIDTFRLWS